MTDIKSLDIFRQIAELGSFQATAQNMGMSLSAISLQMKRLEQFAQLKLFDRSKKTAASNQRRADLSGKGQCCFGLLA